MNNENSRTKNAILNSSFTFIGKLLTLALSFVVRTVFIRVLTKEYLGLNGLFSNIITMLSLADLGIGIAIPYSLYKPLAEKDTNKINILMNFYKKIYNIIGIFVLLVGIGLTPFLQYIIKDMPSIKNIEYIYILFVINSAVSYFFIYKQTLIESDQKAYITTKISIIVTIIKSIIEIGILVFYKNYILYLCVSIAATIVQNLMISIKCNQIYPFIKNRYKEKIPKTDLQDIVKNIKSVFIYKLAMVIVNGTDNIIISKMIGIIEVGLYSNYLMVINAITTMLTQAFSAITSSIGNYIVTKDKKSSETMFLNINFCNFYIYGVCSICLITLLNPLISVWLGKDYLLPFTTTFFLGLNTYVLGMQNVGVNFRSAYGLFWEARYRPIATVIVNIVASIILAKFLGITGVFIGTFLCRITTTSIFDPYILYKYGFKQSPKVYYKKYIIYMFLFLIIAAISIFITNFIELNTIGGLIVKSIIVFIFTNVSFLLIFRKTKEFQYFYQKLKNVKEKLLNKGRK